LGVVGAFAGGWPFHIFGAPGVSGLNIYSLFVAVIGSVVLLRKVYETKKLMGRKADDRLTPEAARECRFAERRGESKDRDDRAGRRTAALPIQS
jgi:hypothetical protein